MLSINYTKKSGSGYILNFYADTVQDIENFDPTTSFGRYGAPLAGSVVTLVGGDEFVNYYLDQDGSLKEIKTKGGDEPALTPLTKGEIIAGFVVNPNGKSVAEVSEWLGNLMSDSQFENLLWSTGNQSELGFARIFVDKQEDADGKAYNRISIFAPNDVGIEFCDTQIKTFNGDVLEAGWHTPYTNPVADITDVTEFKTSDSSKNVTIEHVEPDFDFLNGYVIGAVVVD